jgi:hypothetical protein
MNFSPERRRRVGRHSGAWLLLAGLLGGLNYLVRPGQLRMFGLPYSTGLLLGLAGAVYAHFWLVANLLERRRYGSYAVATAATIGAGALLVLGIGQLGEAAASSTPGLAALAAATNVAVALGLSTLTRYAWRSVAHRFQVQRLRTLQLETELNLLKAQVNQHFLFNTLNNLYGLSIGAPEQMPEAVLQLAGLMRYQLDSSRLATVTVGTEAEYLANYVGLEKLRLRANTQVEFVVDLPQPQQRIVPLLLLPLLENCFKHAIGPAEANDIRISLTQQDGVLTLRTDNSIPVEFRPAASGLGLPALRTRLAQFYPGPRHHLTLVATPSRYIATLRLVL